MGLSSLFFLNHAPLIAVMQGWVRGYALILYERTDKNLIREVTCQNKFLRHIRMICFCNTSLAFFFSPSARLKEEVCLSTSSHGDFRRYFFFLFHLVSELKGSCWHEMEWILAGWKGIPCLVAEQHRVGAAFKTPKTWHENGHPHTQPSVFMLLWDLWK